MMLRGTSLMPLCATLSSRIYVTGTQMLSWGLDEASGRSWQEKYRRAKMPWSYALKKLRLAAKRWRRTPEAHTRYFCPTLPNSVQCVNSQGVVVESVFWVNQLISTSCINWVNLRLGSALCSFRRRLPMWFRSSKTAVVYQYPAQLPSTVETTKVQTTEICVKTTD